MSSVYWYDNGTRVEVCGGQFAGTHGTVQGKSATPRGWIVHPDDLNANVLIIPGLNLKREGDPDRPTPQVNYAENEVTVTVGTEELGRFTRKHTRVAVGPGGDWWHLSANRDWEWYSPGTLGWENFCDEFESGWGVVIDMERAPKFAKPKIKADRYVIRNAAGKFAYKSNSAKKVRWVEDINDARVFNTKRAATTFLTYQIKGTDADYTLVPVKIVDPAAELEKVQAAADALEDLTDAFDMEEAA